MVHASPASSISLSGLIGRLGDSRDVIAPDTLGNGDSAPAGVEEPDIAYYAESSWRVMDQLGIEYADLYGSHTGAHIVSEMAITQPGRVRRMVLDGIAMFEPAEKTEYLAHYAPAMAPDSTGAQFHWALQFVRDQGWFFPYFRRDAAHNRGLGAPSAEALHNTTVEVLKALRTYHYGYRAAFAHDDRGRLPLVKVPSLVMADASDPLARGVPEAARLLPGAVPWIFYDDREDALTHKAAAIAGFLDTGRLNGDSKVERPRS
jgi:pimeloyl-ACP methyl ester carboxylesterase